MKTSKVRINKSYLLNGRIVFVVEKIPGRETGKRNMQSGEMFTGNHRMQKKFKLDTGEIVKAGKLESIT